MVGGNDEKTSKDLSLLQALQLSDNAGNPKQGSNARGILFLSHRVSNMQTLEHVYGLRKKRGG